MGNEAREVLQAQGRAWDLILMTIKKKKKKTFGGFQIRGVTLSFQRITVVAERGMNCKDQEVQRTS